MFLNKFYIIFLITFLFHTAARGEYFTLEEVRQYLEKAILQTNTAMQALYDNPLMGNESVLDVGCGDGKMTAYLAKQLTEGKVLGIDASANMISFAKERFPQETLPNLYFENQDVGLLAYQQEFDLIVSFYCLHWIRDQETVLEKLYQALKYDGKMLVAVPTKGVDDFPGLIYNISKLDRWKTYFQTSVNTRVLYTASEYEELLKKVGFADVHVEIKTIETVFSREEFEEWLYPIVSKNIPEHERGAFVEQLLAEMNSDQGVVDWIGQIHIFSKNIQASGFKKSCKDLHDNRPGRTCILGKNFHQRGKKQLSIIP